MPTPTVALADGGQTSRSAARAGEPLLSGLAATLLPTVQAHDLHGGKTAAQLAEARAKSGAGCVNLNEAVTALFATPTSQLAANGGSQDPAKRRAGGHQPTLADQVEHELRLLPTPGATDGKGPNKASGRTRDGRPRGPGDMDLPDAVARLLPTLRASDGAEDSSHRRTWSSTDRSMHTVVRQGEIGRLLPTTAATDGKYARNSTCDRADPAAAAPHLGDTLADVVGVMTGSRTRKTTVRSPSTGETTASPSDDGRLF